MREIPTREIIKKEAQQKADAIVEKLPSLDFGNHEAVLDWLCEFEVALDRIDVVVDKESVIRVFAEHGYQPHANTGESFNNEDPDNLAHYIVGQMLANLGEGTALGNQLVHKFTNDWKKRFASR